jgi:hypothetical protein
VDKTKGKRKDQKQIEEEAKNLAELIMNTML